MTTQIDPILATLPDPDAVSANEYRTIYEFLTDALGSAEYIEGDTPREYALAILGEFEKYANELRIRIGADEPPDPEDMFDDGSDDDSLLDETNPHYAVGSVDAP